jgi:hypothetical protein
VSRGKTTFLAACLLGMLFGLQVMSARLKSPTYDEQAYIARGYAFVRLGDLHIRIGTPILLNALNALPLLGLPDVRLPLDKASWTETDFHAIGEQFMWEVNGNADQILFLARVPTMLLALLMAAFVYRWARELFGTWSGLLALALCALDPNIIAHGRLATTDLGSTALLFIATYWAWRLLRSPSWRNLLACGAFFGLAQATKFSALLFGPILGLLFLSRVLVPLPFTLRRRPPGDVGRGQSWWQRLWWVSVAGVLVLVVAYLALWAAYGFQVGPISGLTSFPVLAPAHFEQFLDVSGRLAGEEGRQAQAFLMGQLYVGGRWDYFPIAFLLKTPIPTLALLAAALLLRFDRLLGLMGWALWLPPLIYFAASLTSELNLGYRYILPVLPFVFVLAGRMGGWLADRLARLKGLRRAPLGALGCALIGWSLWSGLSIYPHYLAFFNEWAGGPDNGWRYLVDSNIDWGQDLKGLARWMDAHGVESIKLGYEGEAYPSYYGIRFEPLPSWPDRWGHYLYRALYPPDPAPGDYAISVSLIQGRNLVDPDMYAWFRRHEPVDKVGYSIFIYHVPARGGPPASLGLSGVHLSDLRPEDYARLGTNDVRVLWFDAERAIVAPDAQENTFLVFSDDVPLNPLLRELLPAGLAQGSSASCVPSTTRQGSPLSICESTPRERLLERADALAARLPAWHLVATRFQPGDPANHAEQLAYPVRFGEQVELLAYEMDRTSLRPGETVTLVTYWQAQGPGQEPIKLFAHLLDAESNYSGGEDRLDVWYASWREGDLFAQVQQMTLDPDAAPGEYQVEIGWYNPETMQRLPVLRDGSVIADRVLLSAIRAAP